MKESKHYRNTGLQIVSTRWRVCFLDCAKKPVKDMSIRAIYPRIGLELPQQTSQFRMTGDCVQPVSSGRVQRCVWLCLVTLNSPILTSDAAALPDGLNRAANTPFACLVYLQTNGLHQTLLSNLGLNTSVTLEKRSIWILTSRFRYSKGPSASGHCLPIFRKEC